MGDIIVTTEELYKRHIRNLTSEFAALRTLLGRERDQFGKIETELKRELEEVKFARRTENDGYNQKFDHCFQNHIKQIVSKDAEIERLTQKLVNIRALPERSPKCVCFSIANKALRSHDAALAGERGEG